MQIIALCAGLLLASTAAYADPRGIYRPDDMQTARADIKADKRLAKLLTGAIPVARRNSPRR